MITVLHIIYVIEEHFFFFGTGNAIHLCKWNKAQNIIFFLKFHQNMYSFVDLIYLVLTYFLIGKCFVGGLF